MATAQDRTSRPTAAGPHAQLAAAWATFEDIRAVLHDQAEHAGHLIAPFVTAAAAAADGRDALAAALRHLPAGSPPAPLAQALAGATPAEIADSLSAAASKLSTRLEIAALTTVSPQDKEALTTASQHAAAVHRCLAGTG